MWFEKNSVLILFNVISGLCMLSLMVFGPNFILTPILVIVLFIVTNIYNCVIVYNKTIDKTVELLGKHYAEQVKKEVREAFNKIEVY